MARGRTGWMIKAVISIAQIRNEVDRLIATYESAKRTAVGTAFESMPFWDNRIHELEVLKKGLRADGRTILGRSVKRHAAEIASNVMNRYNRRFPSGSRRLSMALGNSDFYRVIFDSSSQEVFIGIGNIDLLDEYTSIYVDSEGNNYEPPGDYEGSGWWRFWEFSGIGPQKEFRSFFTFRYVAQQGWLRKKTLPSRPIFLFNNDLFDEDKKVVRDMPQAIVTRILRASFK